MMNANAVFTLVGMIALPVVACLAAEAIGSVAPSLARRWSTWFQPKDASLGWTARVKPTWHDEGSSTGASAAATVRSAHGAMNSLPIRQA